MVVELDPSFIQNSSQKPNLRISELKQIPVIDLHPLLDPNNNPKTITNLVSQVEEACKVWGFFQVINHGVPTELLARVRSTAGEFFSLPLEEKNKVRRNEGNFLGYYDAENTKNVRDWKETFDFTSRGAITVPVTDDEGEVRVEEVVNRWPEYPIHMRETCMEYAKEVEILAFKLLELISMTLNLPPNHLNGYFNQDSSSRIRFNHYPPCPAPDLALGVGPHKDQGAITILAQDDVGGLDVKRKSDGEWTRVNPVPDSYIINVGDLIQVWSNDKYESAEHRASVNSEKERFSIPFFFYPAFYTVMKPVEELVTEDSPAKYSEFTFGRFFKSRRNSNFQKLGAENLQIYHFKNII